MRYTLHIHLLLLLWVATNTCAFAQNDCPINIDFELGNYTGWDFYEGTCCPITLYPTNGPVYGRHTLVSSGTDRYGRFPLPAPGGGKYSLKLGNDTSGAEAEGARIQIKVPANVSFYIITYQYAVVFEDPSHLPSEQPRFMVTVYDSVSGDVLPCNQFTYVSAPNLPDFYESFWNSDVYYRPWTTVSLDLGAYAGQTLILDFSNGDCSKGGHFGYGYLDVSCNPSDLFAIQCNGGANIQLSAPPGFQSYIWMNTVFTKTYATTRLATLPLTDLQQQYALIVTPKSSTGCIDTLYVDFLHALTTVQPDSQAVCQGASITLDSKYSSNSEPVEVVWKPGIHLSCDSCFTPTAVSPTTGKRWYRAIVIDKHGCSDSAGVLLNILKNVTATASADTTLCQGDTVHLSATGGSTYHWYPDIHLSATNMANTIAQPEDSQRYRVVVGDIDACNDTAEVMINVLQNKLQADKPDDICTGDSVQLNASGGSAYVWSPAALLDDPYSSTPKAHHLTTTLFSVFIDHPVCDFDDTLEVLSVVNPLPEVTAVTRDIDCGNSEGILLAKGASKYKWTPVDGLVNPESDLTVASPTQTTVYTVTGIDSNGCTGTAEAKLTVYDGDGRLFIPDAFTPNGDGLNDCYRVHVPGNVTDFEFSIYNRFGERVFHTTAVNQCWDGSYKGMPAEQSTYFYYYTANSTVCGKVFRKGDMHLLR